MHITENLRGILRVLKAFYDLPLNERMMWHVATGWGHQHHSSPQPPLPFSF